MKRTPQVVGDSDVSRLRDADAATHPGFAAFCRQLRGKDYGEQALNSAWDAFKTGWSASEDASASPYLSRHLTHAERRQIAHAMRQLADAARHSYGLDPPPTMPADEAARLRERILAEASAHDRLAGDIERNGLRFTDPAAGDATTGESQ